MDKYEVTILIDACNGVTVEAESPEEAADLAYETKEASPNICHHCSSELNIGDCIGVIVFNSDDEELYNDTVSDETIKRLESRIKELESKLVEANNG